MAKQTINGVDYYERESDAREAYAVRPAKGTIRPVLLLTHGIGERSAGLLPNLLNVVDGWDYDNNPDTPRQYPFETDVFEAFAAKYDFHLVTVTYPQSFEPNDYVYVLGQVLANYSVDKTRLYAAGFSLGGGAILKLGTSSVQNASMMAGLIAAAPVNWATTHKNVADAKLQMVVTTCEQDDTVSPSNAKDFVAKVNAFNPEFPAFLIIYPGRAHSGFNEILGEENTWKWMAANSTTKRIPFTRSGGSIPVPPPVTSELKPVPDYTLNGNLLTLDGSKSTGQTYGKWAFTAAPAGLNIYGMGLGGNITAKYTLPKPGIYKVMLTVENAAKQTATQEVTINYDGGVVEPKKLIEATGSIVLKYSDGSTGTAKVSVVDGVLKVIE